MLKKQFHIACASAGITMSQWARENKVSIQFVCQLISGDRKSRRIRAKVDEFIATEFKKLNISKTLNHQAA